MLITLYKECKIKYNDVLEKTQEHSILDYLDSLEHTDPIKLNLNKAIFNETLINVKLNRALKKLDLNSYNYAKIEHEGDLFFYFIIQTEWLAESTTDFGLLLDINNTFEYKANIISDTTKMDTATVIKEHRDRFTKEGKIIIDKTEEGFGGLPQIIKETSLLNNNDNYAIAYYSKEGTANGQLVKIACSKNQANYELETKIIKASDYFDSAAKWLFFYSNNRNDKLSYVDSDNNHDNVNILLYSISQENKVNMIYKGHWQGNNILRFDSFNTATLTGLDAYINDNYKIQSMALKSNLTPSKDENYTLERFYDFFLSPTELTPTKTTLELLIPNQEQLMNEDSKIVKFIEVPYLDFSKTLPYWDKSLVNWVPSIDQDYQEISIKQDLEPSIELPTNLFQQPHNPVYETKLLNSQFNLISYKYDSFVFNLPLEDLSNWAFDIKAVIPTNLSSNLLFKFDYEGTKNSEFSNFLIASRNNEIATGSNTYIDYMNNGYNYNKKSKVFGSMTNALSLAGTLGTGALAIKSGITGVKGLENIIEKQVKNKLLESEAFYTKKNLADPNFERSYENMNKVKQKMYDSAVSSNLEVLQPNDTATQLFYSNASNMANSAIGTISNEIQGWTNLEHRKQDYLNTATNISGSEDLILFNYYNQGNKLRRTQYKLLDNVKDSIYEILRLTGYATNEHKIPDLTTRIYYNYIQANVIYKQSYFIPKDFMANILSNFNEGLTLFHYQEGYDLDRTYENFETCLKERTIEIKDLELTANCNLNSEGQFESITYSLKNPNNFKVTANLNIGTFDLAANASIASKSTSDNYELIIEGDLTK